MSGTRQTRIRNMLSWYMIIANTTVMIMEIHQGRPTHRHIDAKT